ASDHLRTAIMAIQTRLRDQDTDGGFRCGHHDSPVLRWPSRAGVAARRSARTVCRSTPLLATLPHVALTGTTRQASRRTAFILSGLPVELDELDAEAECLLRRDRARAAVGEGAGGRVGELEALRAVLRHLGVEVGDLDRYHRGGTLALLLDALRDRGVR